MDFDFGLGENADMIRETTRRFASEQIAPVAGLLRDVSGSYALVLHAVIAACLVAASAMAAVMMSPASRGRRAASPV